MGQISEYFRGELLKQGFNRDTYTPPYNQFEVAAVTQVPPLNVDVADLVEPVGNAYARATIPYNTASWTFNNFCEMQSAVDIVFPSATGFWGSIEAYVFLTSNSGSSITKYVACISRLVVPLRVTSGIQPAIQAGGVLFGLYD